MFVIPRNDTQVVPYNIFRMVYNQSMAPLQGRGAVAARRLRGFANYLTEWSRTIPYQYCYPYDVGNSS